MVNRDASKRSEEPRYNLIGSVDDFLFFVVLRLSVWRMDQFAAVFVLKILFPELQLKRSQYYVSADRIELVGVAGI